MGPLQSIQQLKHKLTDLAEDFDALEALLKVDVPSSLNKIRFITEKVLQGLCKTKEVGWGQAEPTLERMIGPLVAADCIPKSIAVHVRTIQMNTSPGSHYQESALSESHVRIAQNALIEFLDWYCRQSEGLSADAEPKLSPARSRAEWAGVLRMMIGGGCLAYVLLTPLVLFFYIARPDPEKDKDALGKGATPAGTQKDKHEVKHSPTEPSITKAEEDAIQVRISKDANRMGQVAVRTLLPGAQPGRTIVQTTLLSPDGKTVEIVIRVEYESTFGKRDAVLKISVDSGNVKKLDIGDLRSWPGAVADNLRDAETRLQELWSTSK